MKIPSGFVVARCNPSGLFQTIPKTLHFVAVSIYIQVNLPGLFPTSACRNDGFNTVFSEPVKEMVSIIAFIGNERVGTLFANELSSKTDVGTVSCIQDRIGRIAEGIGRSVNFGRQSATAASETRIGAWCAVWLRFFCPAAC